MSPIDAMIAKEWAGSCTHAQHLDRLKEMSTELKGIARENDRQARTERNRVRNRGTKSPSFEVGDLVFEKNETRKDSLDPKFIGPYPVSDVRGTSVKISKRNKQKWIHASRTRREVT